MLRILFSKLVFIFLVVALVYNLVKSLTCFLPTSHHLETDEKQCFCLFQLFQSFSISFLYLSSCNKTLFNIQQPFSLCNWLFFLSRNTAWKWSEKEFTVCLISMFVLNIKISQLSSKSNFWIRFLSSDLHPPPSPHTHPNFSEIMLQHVFVFILNRQSWFPEWSWGNAMRRSLLGLSPWDTRLVRFYLVHGLQ